MLPNKFVIHKGLQASNRISVMAYYPALHEPVPNTVTLAGQKYHCVLFGLSLLQSAYQKSGLNSMQFIAGCACAGFAVSNVSAQTSNVFVLHYDFNNRSRDCFEIFINVHLGYGKTKSAPSRFNKGTDS